MVEASAGPAQTILDGSDLTRGDEFGSTVLFVTGEDSESTLRGFTVTGGTGYDDRGGGIYCEETTPLIEECIIVDNSAEHGGGVWLGSANVTLRVSDSRSVIPRPQPCNSDSARKTSLGTFRESRNYSRLVRMDEE